MHWVISDIHGCFAEYQELISTLSLTSSDTLYVLGDATDRGPASAAVLRDVLTRPGTIYVPGNHDYFLRRLGPWLSGAKNRPSLYERVLRAGWMLDGGCGTAAQLGALPPSELHFVLQKLNEAPAWLEVSAGGRRYVLVHKAVRDFLRRPRFADWELHHFLRREAPYDRPLFADGRIVVSGHTLTSTVRPDKRALVYETPGRVAIDCGCAFGGALAAYCLDDGRTLYTPSRSKPSV